MYTIIVTTLLTSFCLTLYVKWNIGKYIQKFARWIRSRFIHELSECGFCVSFWIAVILVAFQSIFVEIDINLFLAPFCASGAIKMFQ